MLTVVQVLGMSSEDEMVACFLGGELSSRRLALGGLEQADVHCLAPGRSAGTDGQVGPRRVGDDQRSVDPCRSA
ncbi:hypothetical protein GCM10010441_40040 [Kitasatospora paracochleata]|uniref:Uncharacterized protein n=1 Tax=Kitasatospora paracochleata TaxID=58354 RepID=A0ABT1IVX0_9ACTN|nr:hypothetical protein [Kitasatospora paracochleata]